jgi:excisionase family DNA binding protein
VLFSVGDQRVVIERLTSVEPFMTYELAETSPDASITQPEPHFYTYAAIAKMFGRTPRTVRWWVKSGRLRAVKIGCARFIPETELHRLNSDGEG